MKGWRRFIDFGRCSRYTSIKTRIETFCLDAQIPRRACSRYTSIKTRIETDTWGLEAEGEQGSRYTSIKTRIETDGSVLLFTEAALSLHFHQNKD